MDSNRIDELRQALVQEVKIQRNIVEADFMSAIFCFILIYIVQERKIQRMFSFFIHNLLGNFDEGRKIHQSTSRVRVRFLGISDTRPASQSVNFYTRRWLP